MDKERIQKTYDTLVYPLNAYPNTWWNYVFYQQAKEEVINNLIMISYDIAHDFPNISQDLFTLKDSLFFPNNTYNPVVLGEIVEMLSLLIREEKKPLNDCWDCIHPQIIRVSKKQFESENYADAAVNAFIEINDRVKQIYKRLSHNTDKILDGQALMNKVFSKEDTLLDICDRTVESGEDIHEGTRFMLAGAMAALRNPKAHANITISAEEAMRRLMFASMLMYLIDDAEARKSAGDSNGK